MYPLITRWALSRNREGIAYGDLNLRYGWIVIIQIRVSAALLRTDAGFVAGAGRRGVQRAPMLSKYIAMKHTPQGNA